jgi:hypothetical protein
MSGFEKYAQELDHLVSRPGRIDLQSAAAHLDGRPSKEIRRTLKRTLRREKGIFLTPSNLADEAVSAVPGRLTGSTVIDPACGCGDLLLSAMRSAALAQDLGATCFEGIDRERELVAVATARLELFARSEGWDAYSGTSLAEVQTGDGSKVPRRFGPNDVILLNPPFGQTIAPPSCGWSSGLTSSAALFLDRVLARMEPGARLSAILPEVIRSGSRYLRFRERIAGRLDVQTVKALGRFDAHADIDVFLLVGIAGGASGGLAEDHWTGSLVSSETLADHFDISVGPVVDYRDPRLGPWRPFITARSLAGRVRLQPNEHRRFRGRVFDPPFAVTGRTSRPADGSDSRLRVSVITGTEPVAVENHLLVIWPHKRTIKSCLQAKAQLESPETSRFLDGRIRLRHLTVQALREIPWRSGHP